MAAVHTADCYWLLADDIITEMRIQTIILTRPRHGAPLFIGRFLSAHAEHYGVSSASIICRYFTSLR